MSLPRKSLDILLLLDVPYEPPADQDFSSLLKTPEFKHERDVVRALKRLGHKVRLFGIYDDIFPLAAVLKRSPPDLVFPQCEAFNVNRDLEPNIVALLELFGIPYAGASSEALRLCKDKGLSKKILDFHGIRVPRFVVSERAKPLRAIPDMPYPALCKPLGLEASEGISQASLVHDEESCLERVEFLHDRYDADVIIEEYIEGRELYVGILGNEKLTVLPPQELYFKRMPKHVPRFATFKAKWDETYRKKWGIDTGKARYIPPPVKRQLDQTCKTIYRIFKLSGYARIDLRLTSDWQIVFLEANANPAIGRHDDFAWAAKEAGIPYTELIRRIVSLAFKDQRERLKAAS